MEEAAEAEEEEAAAAEAEAGVAAEAEAAAAGGEESHDGYATTYAGMRGAPTIRTPRVGVI